MLLFWGNGLFDWDRIPVCAEVFVEDGGEGQREMRGGESCFEGLAVHHSTHRLVFLNYTKLHLHSACQRLHLWAQCGANVVLVPCSKPPTPQSLPTRTHTETYTFPTQTLTGMGGMGGRSGSDSSLIPVNPLLKTKSLKSQTVFFPMASRRGRPPARWE